MKLYDPSFAEIISVLEESAMPNPFCHVELNTTDLKKAKDFYGKLFDWKLEDMPGADYTMIGVGEGTGGGMMKNPIPGAPSFWLSYILVDDVRAATKKAASLGGSVMKDVTPVPNFGEFSVITDPTGAHFALWQPKNK
jgi:predicted enzyme related to lactoylglutathione lyase